MEQFTPHTPLCSAIVRDLRYASTLCSTPCAPLHSANAWGLRARLRRDLRLCSDVQKMLTCVKHYGTIHPAHSALLRNRAGSTLRFDALLHPVRSVTLRKRMGSPCTLAA